MNEGSKYRLYIPQELAYGAHPHPGGPIQPFSALIFDVELLQII
jgi:FKBP-type peptidyl-prolyl cis-trans isomerase FklB